MSKAIFSYSLQYLEKNGVKNLQREHFSFSTKVFIGDFLKPTGKMSENGEEKYARLSGKEMYDDIDKLRRENGWKPRRRGSTKQSSTAKVRENATASPAAPQTQAATPAAAAVGNSLQQQQQQSSTMVKNSSKTVRVFHQMSLVAQRFQLVEF